MKATITVGISASGKTTWAKEHAKSHKAIISNRDDLRFSLTGANGWGDYRFDKKIEQLVSYIQMETAQKAAAVGKDFILADTNLDQMRREGWVEALKNFGYIVEIKTFPITLEEAWKRDSLRGNGVGRDVIYKQWQQWLVFSGRKQYVPDFSLPKAVIFDIDGTLAHMDGRGAFEWGKVGTDKPDDFVRPLFRSTVEKCIVVSGRDGSCYEDTLQWLHETGMPPDELLMRPANDFRKDTVIKEEIFWRDIAPYFNVQAVYDDRPCVVRMWHDLKIPKVIAVGNQSVEF